METALKPDLDTGVFMRRDVLALGLNDRTIERNLRDGTWMRLRTGAYAENAWWTTLDERHRRLAVATAVLRKAGTAVALSHSSAVDVWDAPAWALDTSNVEVARLDGKAGRRHAGVVQHRGWAGVEDVTWRDGIRVMSATRTALDICTTATAEAALVTVDGMLCAGHTTLEHLARRRESMLQTPHSLPSQVVLRLASPRSCSVGESRTKWACFRAGLPQAELQYEVWSNGRLVAQLDMAWPVQKVWLEFDGKVKYTTLVRPGETAGDVVWREKQREDLVRRLTGWICVRVTWADLEQPDRLVAKIRQAFRDAARAS